MELSPDLPYYAYSSARSLCYTAEHLFFESIARLIPSFRAAQRSRGDRPDWKTLLEVRKDLQRLLRRDASNIATGIYPASVLQPDSPIRHWLRYPKLVLDGISIYSRKARGRTAEFDPEASRLAGELPCYYRRNFHFQTGGYLTERSAEVYEHQVELLFHGSADAMRRLILSPLRRRFRDNPTGNGLRFLELGTGTGRATRFVTLAFPKARIIAVDLSDPYLSRARRNLERFSRIDFLHADAAALPFKDSEFDAVYSVFLFHELPMDVRRQVIAESVRVTRPGGFLGLVDSLQSGDKKIFDSMLERFPEDFHEPFYRNYIANPIEELLGDPALSGNIEVDFGFSSKVSWTVKSLKGNLVEGSTGG